MPRLLRLTCALLVPALTACQATVNLNEGTESSGNASTEDTNNSNATDTQTTADCPEGAEGCACYGNHTCDDKLVCTPDDKCEAVPGESTGDTTNTTGDTTNTTVDTSGTTNDMSGTTNDMSGTTNDMSGTTNDMSGTTNDMSGTSDSTTGGTTGDTSDDTTGDPSDGTTGGGDPDCADAPADMVCVPAATFEMGTSLNLFQGDDVFASEKPAHDVTLTKSFWIDRNEVTVEDYAVCWALKICELPVQGQGYNWGMANKEKYPINGVNWYQAKKYCEWKGKRLLTEAEWELAARGTDGRMYPWGNAKPTCNHIVADGCGTVGTQAVGSKPLGKSPYGALDMAGNVVEWCSDYHKDDYYYESPLVDPKGPIDGTKRAARSFSPPLYGLVSWGRATLRAGYSPLLADVNPQVMGIRCGKTAP